MIKTKIYIETGYNKTYLNIIYSSNYKGINN